MPIPFKCANCSFQTKVKDELAGKKIKCPKCQTAGVIAAAEEEEIGLPLAGLENLNLDKFKDVVPDEDEEEEEEDEPLPVAKKKKNQELPKPSKRKEAPPISPAAKLATILFVLMAFAIIGAQGFLVMNAQQ